MWGENGHGCLGMISGGHGVPFSYPSIRTELVRSVFGGAHVLVLVFVLIHPAFLGMLQESLLWVFGHERV